MIVPALRVMVSALVSPKVVLPVTVKVSAVAEVRVRVERVVPPVMVSVPVTVRLPAVERLPVKALKVALLSPRTRLSERLIWGEVESLDFNIIFLAVKEMELPAERRMESSGAFK